MSEPTEWWEDLSTSETEWEECRLCRAKSWLWAGGLGREAHRWWCPGWSFLRVPNREGARMSLRERLIEAGAHAMPGPGYDLSSPEEDAEAVLDAFLGVLADNADEWWVESAEGRAVDCRVEHWVHEPEGLIAVLRGDE